MSEEEKTLEEQTETIIDAIENETEDDVREAFEINKEDGPLAALGAPLIRALGDPDPADPNMIQKHLDNFLAALCGETPVDSNVRTSTEYWLKRLADGEGGSTKKIYCHPIKFERSGEDVWYACGYMIILSASSDPITLEAFKDLLNSPGFWGVVYNGFIGNSTGGDYTSITSYLEGIFDDNGTLRAQRRLISTYAPSSGSISTDGFTITDLGANPIN